jgi:hypothetical protein
LRRPDKVRLLAGLALVGLLATMKLVSCKRDPNEPVAGYRCSISKGECVCTQSREDKGTCGRFQCCYKWELVGHSHNESVCACSRGDPETNACPKADEGTKRVETCP